MKKYTIDDLIIDVPKSEKKRSKKKPIGLYIAIVLLAILLTVGIVMMKTSSDSAEDTNRSQETNLAIEAKSDNALESNRNSLDNNVAETEKKELLDQIARKDQEMKKATDELLITGNDTENLEPLVPKIESNDTIIAQSEKLLETKQEITEPETEEPGKEAIVPPVIQDENRSVQRAAAEVSSSKKIASSSDTENIPDEKQAETPAVQEPQKTADKAPLEDAAIVAQEKTAAETVEDSNKTTTAATSKTEEISKQKEEKSQKEKQEPQRIADVIANKKSKDTLAEKTKPEPKKVTKPSTGNLSKYYIQVGVFNTEPSAKYLSKIKKSGLNYIVVKSGKTRRVRVGPYPSSEQASSAIGKVKKAIGVEGFVVKSTANASTDGQKKEVSSSIASSSPASQKNTKTEKEKEKSNTADTTAQKEQTTNTTVTKKAKSSHKTKPRKSPVFNLFAKKPRYFVQVGKFRGNPPASLMSKIKRARLRYTVSKNKTIQIVLIGPFKTYSSAKGAEGRINSAIGTHGFVVKSKR